MKIRIYVTFLLFFSKSVKTFRMYHIQSENEDFDEIFLSNNEIDQKSNLKEAMTMFDDSNNEIYEVNGTRFRQIHVIFPGTKWCGSGNISEDNWSLGKLKETDSCCREHDFCDDILQPGQTKFNLTNNSLYTKLNCRCDQKFYACLKNSAERESKYVGTIFFNALGTECYMEEYPILGCARYHRILLNRCEEYILDKNLPKIWQWFDVPVY